MSDTYMSDGARILTAILLAGIAIALLQRPAVRVSLPGDLPTPE